MCSIVGEASATAPSRLLALAQVLALAATTKAACPWQAILRWDLLTGRAVVVIVVDVGVCRVRRVVRRDLCHVSPFNSELTPWCRQTRYYRPPMQQRTDAHVLASNPICITVACPRLAYGRDHDGKDKAPTPWASYPSLACPTGGHVSSLEA